MAKGKGTKQQAMIYKTLHIQLKFEQRESHKKLWMLRTGNQFLLH